MLRTTINLRHEVDINSYQNLKVFIKQCFKGYLPKKANVMTLSQVNKFLNASDDSLTELVYINVQHVKTQEANL